MEGPAVEEGGITNCCTGQFGELAEVWGKSRAAARMDWMDAFWSWLSNGGVGEASGAGECWTALATSEASSCADGWWWASEDRPCTVRAIVGQFIAISKRKSRIAPAGRSWERIRRVVEIGPEATSKNCVTHVTSLVNKAAALPGF